MAQTWEVVQVLTAVWVKQRRAQRLNVLLQEAGCALGPLRFGAVGSMSGNGPTPAVRFGCLISLRGQEHLPATLFLSPRIVCLLANGMKDTSVVSQANVMKYGGQA